MDDSEYGSSIIHSLHDVWKIAAVVNQASCKKNRDGKILDNKSESVYVRVRVCVFWGGCKMFEQLVEVCANVRLNH